MELRSLPSALRFLGWFVQDDVQIEWAALGGNSCSSAVLNAPEFQSATRFNGALAQSLLALKSLPPWQLSSQSDDILDRLSTAIYSYVVQNNGSADDVVRSVGVN
jgi:ABC-type glycerol-3-phosphate transport system substrate-binding protein